MDLFSLALLFSLLSDPKFHVRESAHKELARQGDIAAAYILANGLPECPDARHRCQRILDDWKSRRLDKLLTRHHPTPYLDGVPNISSVVWSNYRSMAYDLNPHPSDEGFRYAIDRRALRLWLADQARCPQLDVIELERLLDEAHRRSANYDLFGKWEKPIP